MHLEKLNQIYSTGNWTTIHKETVQFLELVNTAGPSINSWGLGQTSMGVTIYSVTFNVEIIIVIYGGCLSEVEWSVSFALLQSLITNMTKVLIQHAMSSISVHLRLRVILTKAFGLSLSGLNPSSLLLHMNRLLFW